MTARVSPSQERMLRVLRGGPCDEAELCRLADAKPIALPGIERKGYATRAGHQLVLSDAGEKFLRRRDNAKRLDAR